MNLDIAQSDGRPRQLFLKEIPDGAIDIPHMQGVMWKTN